jgi:glutamate racemase
MGAIGVFDSGIGGLTVAREIVRAFPEADLVYLGDTARLPYGAKSPETVTRYALRCVEFLIEAGVEVIVVACNTASACALPALRAQWPHVQIMGVVEPGAQAAVSATRSGRIGVIGTEGTIRSGSYVRAIKALRPDAVVAGLACPLLVPLSEVGWLNHDVTHRTLAVYLRELLDTMASPMDALVLGCTHYPVLKPAIRAVLSQLTPGRDIALVDSAEAVAATLNNTQGGTGNRRFCVTDLPDRFYGVANTFWSEPIATVEHVDITVTT